MTIYPAPRIGAGLAFGFEPAFNLTDFMVALSSVASSILQPIRSVLMNMPSVKSAPSNFASAYWYWSG
jgi:hypothetical protein